MRRRLQQERRPPPSSPSLPSGHTSYPPFKFGGGPLFDAEVPRGQSESRSLSQGHGADSRAIHTEGCSGNVCRGSQLHIPHRLQTGRKARSDEAKYSPASPQAAAGPACLSGPGVVSFTGSGCPRSGSTWSSSGNKKLCVLPTQGCVRPRVRPSWSQMPVLRVMPQQPRNPRENFQGRGSWDKKRETEWSSEFFHGYLKSVPVSHRPFRTTICIRHLW